MVEWLILDAKRQKEILNQVSHKVGLPASVIEKDWWVTFTLRAVFSSPLGKNLVFKGGTSLSKSWNLIERFSEDIDLGLDREVLGFTGDLSKSQIQKLRKTASKFISTEFKDLIGKALEEIGVDKDKFKLSVKEGGDPDRDPQILILEYPTVLEKNAYIPDRVIVEAGARGLREPSSQREVQSIIGVTFPDQPYSDKPFSIETVDPKRTFLEKAFLLHEEFKKKIEDIKHDRLSRHLYDLERLMDTEHGKAALEDGTLYHSIVEHRKKFTPIRGISYEDHHPTRINFIPPNEVIELWEKDYKAMREHMIYGESKDFAGLIQRMKELIERFRHVK